jgi:hypothetical protein
MGSMTGTFLIPEFNSSYTITHRNFVRIGDKKFKYNYTRIIRGDQEGLFKLVTLDRIIKNDRRWLV